MRSRWAFSLVLALLLTLLSVPASAQVGDTGLTGTVSDGTGGCLTRSGSHRNPHRNEYRSHLSNRCRREIQIQPDGCGYLRARLRARWVRYRQD